MGPKSPTFALVYKTDDATKRAADVAIFNTWTLKPLVRSNQNQSTYFPDQGFTTDWGPSYGGSLSSAANMQAYHDHIMDEAAAWDAKGRQLWTFEIGNELDGHVGGDQTMKSWHDVVRQTAQDVKDAYPNIGLISYHCWDYSKYNGVPGNEFSTYDEFVVNGLGGIDILAIHPYGYVGSNVIQPGGWGLVEKMMRRFGSQCIISEFNNDAIGANNRAIIPATGKMGMDHWYRNFVLNYVTPFNSKAMVYLWNGNGAVGNPDDWEFTVMDNYNGKYPSLNQYATAFFDHASGPRQVVA